MKKLYFLIAVIITSSLASAQDPILDSWILNTTGKTSSYWQNTAVGMNATPNFVFSTSSTLADVTEACFDNDSIWIASEGMTNDMGQFTNPGAPSGQSYVFSFPRNPTAGTGNVEVPVVNMIGVLTNGIPMYGLSDGTSYDKKSDAASPMGQGIWVGDAYYSEGETLDTAFAAHPQQTGAYHSHATPFRLYTDPSGAHSPIVGFASDGFPVYGPFGYTSAMDKNSGTTRMTSSYSLRNITTRTTLPDGTNSMPPGPDVTTNGDFDLGIYIQDYEYIASSGTLDEHNGRLCVTPEYPSGTYAYFVTVDALGTPIFPYYVGTTYYGTPVDANNKGTGTMPSSGVSCLPIITSTRASDFLNEQINVFPNPVNNQISFTLPDDAKGNFDLKIIDNTGKMVLAEFMVDSSNEMSLNTSKLNPGIYFLRVIGYNQLFTASFIKK